MAVEPDQPADVSDVWMRVLTSEDYWKKSDGSLHNNAFGGKAIAPPEDKRDWSLELSGRLLSFVVNVRAESEAFCSPPRVFVGLMYQTVENLRSNGESFHRNTGCQTDVIYTPKAYDIAHSDLVAYGPTQENRFLIRDWLQDFIQYVRPDNCDIIEGLRRA